MDEDNLLIICRVCGRKVLMHNMRPDDDGEHMICNDCWKKKSGAKSASSVLSSTGSKHIENTPMESPKSKVVKTEKAEKMMKYICTNCKYKFSRKMTQEVQKCPYCGKTTIVQDTQLGAEKLINESTSKKYDW